ncbi:hypothetical protein JOD24_001915 [Kroppenstedtia sanguinis]
MQRAHSETGNGVTLARLVPYGYKGSPPSHHPFPSLIFHTMIAEGALEALSIRAGRVGNQFSL